MFDMRPNPLYCVELVVSDFMRGAKKAVKMGNKIHCSPAMYDIIRHASQEELHQLLSQIPLLDLGEPFDFRKPMPLTSSSI